MSLPTKIGARGDRQRKRSADTPISVWGASVIGGEAVEQGVWELFIGLLISINFFLGLFNPGCRCCRSTVGTWRSSPTEGS